MAAPVSFTKLRSFLPRYASFHHVRSSTFCCSAWHPDANTQTFPWQDAQSLSQASATILTGFHSASLRHSFTSVSFSPPAAFFCCARRPPHLGCVHLATAICSCRTSISQSSANVHLHSSAASVPSGKITPAASYVACTRLILHLLLQAPLWGLAVRIHSSFLLIPAAVRRLAAAGVDKCTKLLCCFWPQALLPWTFIYFLNNFI